MKKIFIGLLVVAFPLLASAQVTDINGQTGSSQTIVGDGINIDVSSGSDITTVTWTGILNAIGGGTGVDMSSFTPGSILYWDGSEVAQNNSNLNWDGSALNVTNLNAATSITTTNLTTQDITFPTTAGININSPSIGDADGGYLTISSASGHDNGNGGALNINSGSAGAITGNGGFIDIAAGNAIAGMGGSIELDGGNVSSSGDGGQIVLNAGSTSNGLGGVVYIQSGGALGGSNDGGAINIMTRDGHGSGNGGDVIFTLGNGGSTGQKGKFIINSGILDFNSLGAQRAFTFPDASGTFSLLESDQTFSGINSFTNPVTNFISSTNNTIHIGDSSIPGCIAMEDDDGGGMTWVTAHRGVLSATTSQPGNCN